MTKFTRKDFQYSGGYLEYRPDWTVRGRFVARFKRTGRDKAGFVAFLCKHFTVEEYFRMYDVEKMAPATILESKGYVSLTVRQTLGRAGYPATAAGKEQYLKDQADRWVAEHKVA